MQSEESKAIFRMICEIKKNNIHKNSDKPLFLQKLDSVEQVYQ